ncbi:hypothetical protein [Agromyces laixinhei]|uniref:hypothetical protein n=1 Tax=Agromyces laixinhei TaxID=2585717 RepID=UPI0012EE6B35|nr:hypothetical protein [Agromyces laixinhei]
MSDLALFDLAVAWVPIPVPDYDMAAYDALPKAEKRPAWRVHVAEYRCRDCGTRQHLNQGSGQFVICDECALVDQCREVDPDQCRSLWGVPAHTLAEHDELTHARERRRARYLASGPITDDSENTNERELRR